MASSQSFSMIQRRMLLSPWPASPVKSDEPLWTSAMRLPSGVLVLHLREHVGQEQHLAVAGAGDERVLRIAGVLDDEARVLDAVLAAHPLEVALPALAVGRIGEHEVELARRETRRSRAWSAPAPPTMLSAASPSPLSSRSALQMA